MSSHAPKLLALEALLESRLSEVAQARLERHLAACETCRAALVAMREYTELRDAARSLPMPELSWQRVEAALDAEGARVARGRTSGKLLALALPLLAVAATVIIGWVGISGQRETAQLATRPPAPSTTAPAPQPTEEPRLTAWVTLGMSATQTPGTEVHEGDVLRTGAGEERHLHLADNTGIVLWPDSELVVTRLRQHSVRLTLRRGGVSNRVRKLASDDSYVVDSGPYAAEVRGTHFFVGRDGEDFRANVHEGSVAILLKGKQIDLLQAGGSYSSGGANAAPSVDRVVIGLDDASLGWPTLRLPALPQVQAWHMGEERWAASADLAMRAPPGELLLSFEDARGRLHALEVNLSTQDSSIEESMLRAALRSEAEARTGVLAPEQISPVIMKALPTLKRCYERSLRREPKLEGRLTLAVRVAADGHVARADLRGETPLPEDLTQCIAGAARGWAFPAPQGGGAVSFEVPLNLKSASSH